MRNAFTARVATAAASIAATLLAFPVYASTLLDTTGLNTTAKASGITKGSSNDLAAIAGNVINAALGLSGIVIVVLFVYAGFLWMTAQGDDKKVADAKKIIKNAIIGTILMFSAYVIANTVAAFITNAGIQ